MKYIPEMGLAHLSQYKYQGSDKSLLANYVLQRFWGRAVTWLPTWMAPNLVTLLGFIPMVIVYALYMYYCPTFTEAAPTWLYILSILSLFIYQTMDAIDGKQARRTGTSSPLGELFDHGCDALTTIFVALSTAAAVRLGATMWMAVPVFGVLIPFYLTQWEEYFSGILNLGYISVTEAQVGVMGVFATSAILGSDFWLNEMTVAGHTFKYAWIPMGAAVVTGFFTSASNIWTAFREVLQGGKGTFLQAVLYGVPMQILIGTSYIWVKYSEGDIVSRYPHEFGLILGFCTALLVGRIIVSRVCGLPGIMFPPALTPLIFACINVVFFQGKLVEEKYVIYFNLIWFIVAYMHFALSIIEEMCAFLKIRCLRIPYPNKATEEERAKAKKH